jgi:hypothetical protein
LLCQLDGVIADAKADKAYGAVVAAYGLIVKIAGLLNEQHAADLQFAGARDVEAVVDATIEQLGGLDTAIDATSAMLDALRERGCRARKNRLLNGAPNDETGASEPKDPANTRVIARSMSRSGDIFGDIRPRR